MQALLKFIFIFELTQFFVSNFFEFGPNFGAIKDATLVICITILLVTKTIKITNPLSLFIGVSLLALYAIKLPFVAADKGYFMPRIFIWFFLITAINIQIRRNRLQPLSRLVLITSTLFSIIVTLFDADSFLISIGYPASVWSDDLLNHSWYTTGGELIRFGGFMVSPIAFGLFALWHLITFKGNMKRIEIISVLVAILGTQSRLLIVAALFFLLRGRLRNTYVLFLASVPLILFLLTSNLNSFVADRSALGHYSSLIRGISLLGELPILGFDPGTFGSFVDNGLVSGNVIESGLLLLILEHGWLFGSLLVLGLFSCSRDKRQKTYFQFVFVISIFLPVYQYFSVLLFPALIESEND